MHEIAGGVYIENAYIGVTLGAINLSHGLMLIDAPPRAEDVRSWRASLLNLGGGVDRLLVNLDAHADRTLGARSMECTVVAHEKTALAFRNRPTAFKQQDIQTGADWELVNGVGIIRWAPPEITFTDSLSVYWDDAPVVLEHHPGPQPGAIWVLLPQQGVVFTGDSVVPGQPPFLASADLPTWINTLTRLLEPRFNGYLIVSGRTGLVSTEQVRAQIDLLNFINSRIQALAEQKASPEATESLVPELLKRVETPQRRDQFTQRLKWGLSHYYVRHYHSGGMDDSIEE
jgi:glyoxylase-like metal-dependent hydrolase (beta-lactamase superfamily II)